MTAHSYRYFKVGDRFFIVFLAFLSAFPPITTDMYLPAMPAMGSSLQASNELVSYTISGYMLVFALSMLIWGPLSDRYGRKPILWAGCFIYTVASVFAAIAPNIELLLLWRGFQAIGSGSAASMALAIVRDIYRGRLMEKVIGLMQASMIVAPMAAPVLGGFMLAFTSWRGIFWFLAAFGLLAMIGLAITAETSPKSATHTTLPGAFARMGILLGQPGFRWTLLTFAAMSMPFMSYLGVSAFIYQNEFHHTAQAFSLFFAANACFSLAGPIAHIKWLRKYNRAKVLTAEIALMCAFGILVIVFGGSNSYVFALLFMPITFCGSAMRAPSTVQVMELVPGDAGAVSALINSGALLFGSMSMFIAALSFWPNQVVAVGCISAMISAACLATWLHLQKR